MTTVTSNNAANSSNHAYKIAILCSLWLVSVCGLGYLWLTATGAV